MGIHNLTDRTIKAAKTACTLRDGGGLELRVKNENSKSWVLRKTVNGLRKEYGLGSLVDVPLKVARDKAEQYRQLIDQGVDPKFYLNGLAKARKVKDITFREAADRYISEHEAEWTNEKHRKQWRSTIETYANPIIGSIPVAQLTADHILEILKPIWIDKTETATRIRERIEKIIGAGAAMGIPMTSNPATWKGNLEFRLAKPSKVKNETHFPAMPHQMLPDFWLELRDKNTDGSRALQLIILTAARTGEILLAQRSEIDLTNNIWTIPAERVKTKTEHVIPITAHMKSIIERQIQKYSSDLLFPGSRYGKPLSNMTCLKVMKDLGYTELKGSESKGHYVPHGFRATFSTWAFENGNHGFEVIESCLGHNVGNNVHRAYQRSTLLNRRKTLMTDWNNFVTGTDNE